MVGKGGCLQPPRVSRVRRARRCRTGRPRAGLCRVANEQADVIVVGGGVAGLAAAGAIARRGLTVLVLEARDRFGGRIFTERRAGWSAPVELGAEFVHMGNDDFWRLLRRHRIGTKKVPQRHWRFDDTGIARIGDVAKQIANVTGRIEAARMHGWSFAEFLRRKATNVSAADRELACGFVEGFEAAPMDQMSAAALEGETLDDDEQFAVPSGYDRLVRALTDELGNKRVILLCRAAVSHVEWRRGESPGRPARIHRSSRGADVAAGGFAGEADGARRRSIRAGASAKTVADRAHARRTRNPNYVTVRRAALAGIAARAVAPRPRRIRVCAFPDERRSSMVVTKFKPGYHRLGRRPGRDVVVQCFGPCGARARAGVVDADAVGV